MRRDLVDPRRSLEPVSRIGARWGFASPGQFSRDFRTAYGLPPTEYRAIGLGELRASPPAAVTSAKRPFATRSDR
jgi:AraC-like DNA-binding protein